MVGVAMVDSLRHRLEVAEFSDDSTFSTLESILLQHSPRSCIVQDKKSNTNSRNAPHQHTAAQHRWPPPAPFAHLSPLVL